MVFVSPLLSFCPIYLYVLHILVIKKNGLDRKISFISKLMNSKLGSPTIAMRILLNILRKKGSQTIKPGQLIEYNLRNIFLTIHTQNVLKKLSKTYSKKSKLSIYLE